MTEMFQKQSLRWVVLVCCILVVVGVVFLVGTVNPVSAETTDPELDEAVSGAVATIASLLPLFFVVTIILYVFRMMGGDTDEEKAVDDYWEKYGERVKLAYTSKFGGENKGFNQEVDKRVMIMVNNGKGFTRAISKSWLKRMHKFTEAK